MNLSGAFIYLTLTKQRQTQESGARTVRKTQIQNELIHREPLNKDKPSGTASEAHHISASNASYLRLLSLLTLASVSLHFPGAAPSADAGINSGFSRKSVWRLPLSFNARRDARAVISVREARCCCVQ